MRRGWGVVGSYCLLKNNQLQGRNNRCCRRTKSGLFLRTASTEIPCAVFGWSKLRGNPTMRAGRSVHTKKTGPNSPVDSFTLHIYPESLHVWLPTATVLVLLNWRDGGTGTRATFAFPRPPFFRVFSVMASSLSSRTRHPAWTSISANDIKYGYTNYLRKILSDNLKTC